MLIVAAVSVAARPAAAQTLDVRSFPCDWVGFCEWASFQNWAEATNLQKEIIGEARWGNNATTGTTEYKVGEGLRYTSGQYSWLSTVTPPPTTVTDPVTGEVTTITSPPLTTDNRRHTFSFGFDGVVTTTLGLNGTAPLSYTLRPAEFYNAPTMWNTLLIHTAALDPTSSDYRSNLSNMMLSFTNGETINLSEVFTAALKPSTLTGDGDGEWLLYQDSRIGGGFTLTGDAELVGGSGANPLYDFRVGTAQVAPEPMSLLLVGTGLLGIAGVRRRRRRDPV